MLLTICIQNMYQFLEFIWVNYQVNIGTYVIFT